MAYLYAVQEFCDNHGIVETSGKELEQMIGIPSKSITRCLSQLSWTKDTAVREVTWKKNGSQKIFTRMESRHGRKVFARFNEHFKRVLEGLDK